MIDNQEDKWKKYRREYHREWYKKPEVREKIREYNLEYNQRPDIKERRNAYNKAHPEIVIRHRITTYKNFLEKHGFKVIKMEDEA